MKLLCRLLWHKWIFKYTPIITTDRLESNEYYKNVCKESLCKRCGFIEYEDTYELTEKTKRLIKYEVKRQWYNR